MYYIDGKFLAQRIDELCSIRRLSKKEFCRDSGISSGSLSQWRTGKYQPSDDAVEKLESYFGMSISDILDGVFDRNTKAAPDNENPTIAYRNSVREQPGMQILFDAAQDATPADLMEAAALLMRRKEERGVK